MITFINIKGIVHVDCVSEGQTVNQINYKEIYKPVMKGLEEKDLKCGRMAHEF